MRSFPAAAIAAVTLSFAFAGSAAAIAQSAPTQHKKIIGYQDAETGDFHPLAPVDPDVIAAVTPVTGKYQITFDVTLKSSFPSGTQILCEVIVDEVTTLSSPTPPYGTFSSFTEIATGTVAASGSSVVCTASIPYSWIIPPAPSGGKATTVVNGSYSVSAINLSNTTSLSNALRARSSSSQLGIPSKLPTTGSTTSLTVKATL